ncbi:MAG: hypothetical protein WBN75_09645 [Verrucomicrobiia bacterium]
MDSKLILEAARGTLDGAVRAGLQRIPFIASQALQVVSKNP